MIKSPGIDVSNVTRNLLQKKLGPLTNVIDSKSVAELRRANRKSRFVPHAIEFSHLPISNSAALISPPSIKNNRFYNNRLCTPEKNDAKPSSNENPSPVGTVSSESKVMKTNVIRRLVSKMSPVTDRKKKCFKKLVEEDQSAMEIIDIAVEAGNSVQDTTDMLLNFV